jgi:hypothetical protein
VNIACTCLQQLTAPCARASLPVYCQLWRLCQLHQALHKYPGRHVQKDISLGGKPRTLIITQKDISLGGKPRTLIITQTFASTMTLNTSCCRCMLLQSLEYYGQWQGSSSDVSWQDHNLRQKQQQQGMEMEPGLECNAADAEQVHQLLRLTSDDLPESITHSMHFGNPTQQQQQLSAGPQEQQAGSKQHSTEEPAQLSQSAAAVSVAAPAAAEVPGMLSQLGSSTGNISLKSGLGPRVGSEASACSVPAGGTIPPMLSKYYSAVSSFGGLSSTTDHSGNSSFGGRLPSRPVSGGTAAAAAGAGQAGACPVVPCPIVFPCSRRTSKTLAAVMPGVGGVAGNAAGWLGCVGLPVLPEGGCVAMVIRTRRLNAVRRCVVACSSLCVKDASPGCFMGVGLALAKPVQALSRR